MSDGAHNKMTIRNSAFELAGESRLTPAASYVVLRVAHELDQMRINHLGENETVTLSIPAADARGRVTRNENLTPALKLLSTHLFTRSVTFTENGEEVERVIGGPMIAQWSYRKNGTSIDLVLAEGAVNALMASGPKAFTQIEMNAAVNLKHRARLLYVALSRRKNMDRSDWIWDIEELHEMFGLENAYPEWNEFRRRIIDPAVADINKLGTVKLSYDKVTRNRSVIQLKFNWRWKSSDEAAHTLSQSQRHSKARDRRQQDASAPPLTQDDQGSDARNWWNSLSDEARADCRSSYGSRRDFTSGQTVQRSEAEIVEFAYRQYLDQQQSARQQGV